jgi:hypothetical protein
MSRPVSWFVIRPGWSVHARDGSQVGRIEEVLGEQAEDIFNGLVIATGFFSARYVPAERVREITDGRVELDLARDEVDALPDKPPMAHS